MTTNYSENKAREIVEAINNVIMYDSSYLDKQEKRQMTELIAKELLDAYKSGLEIAAGIADEFALLHEARNTAEAISKAIKAKIQEME